MNFLVISDNLFSLLITVALSVLFTVTGSAWINYLYIGAQQRNALSFPDQIEARSRFRKPVLFVLLFIGLWRAWNHILWPASGYTVIAVAFLLLVTMTDFEQQVILNAMLLPFAIIGICFTIHLHLPIQEHMVAALGCGMFFLFLSAISRGSLGGGDIKLIASLGLWIGIKPLISVIIYGAMAAGVAALILLLTQRIKSKQYLAYGPYFALSGIGIMLAWLRVLF